MQGEVSTHTGSVSERGGSASRRTGHEKAKDGQETDGETERTGEDQGKKSRQADQRKKQDQGNAKRLKEEIAANKKDKKLSWGDTKKLKDDIRRVQDEQDVEFDTTKLEFYRKKLSEHTNLNAVAISKMTPAELVVVAQALIDAVGHEEPPKITGKSKESHDKRRQQRLDLQEITEVTRGEELTPAKVEGLIRQVEQVLVEEPSVGAEEILSGAKKETEEAAYKEEVGGKRHYFVESDLRLEFLKKDEVEQVLAQQAVAIELPDNWDKKTPVVRERWLAQKGILSTQDFPNTTVEDRGDGTYGLFVPEISESVIRKALQDNGIEKTPTLPDNFEDLSFKEKRKILKQQGFDVLPMIAGGAGKKWTDNEFEEVSTRVRDPRTGEVVTVTEKVKIDLKGTIDRLMSLAREDADNPLHEWNADWQELSDRLQHEFIDTLRAAASEHKDFDKVSEVYSEIVKLASNYELAGKIGDFNKILPEDIRNEIGVAWENLDGYFENQLREFDRKDPERTSKLLGMIDEEANSVVTVVQSGFYGRADEQRERFWAKAMEIAAQNPDFGELIKWRATKSMEGIELNYLGFIAERPPAIWQDTEKNLNNLFRYVESTHFAEQQLGRALEAAQQMVQRIPVNDLRGKEREDALKLQTELNERIDAVLGVHRFFIQFEHSDMNPEDLAQVIKSLKDQTFMEYFKRFQKDAFGKELDINLLDKAMGMYMKKLFEDRNIMNEIEALTKGSLNKATTSPHEKWLILKLALDDSEFQKLKTQDDFGKAFAKISGKQMADVNEIWRNNLGRKRDAVSAWYKANTILGIDNEGGLIEMRKDLAKEFEGILRSNAAAWGLDEKQVDQMLTTGLIDQVVNNAYRVSWMFAWSDYDGIRVWDHNAQRPGGKGRVGDYVFNESTHMFFGRHLDHLWEFYTNEGRGKVGKTNLLMQESMLGEHGNMLPQNRTMVRFTRMLLKHDPTLKDKYEALIDKKIGSLKNIDRFDLNNEPEYEWARSAAISEMIDGGQVSFENVEWSKVFNPENKMKYLWFDLNFDRFAALKYFGPESLQLYLQQPNTQQFFKINSVAMFYSKREVRIKPWMKLAIPFHKEIGGYWKKWWKLSYNMTHAEADEIIEHAVQSNRLEAEAEHSMKLKYLGWGPFAGGWTIRHAREMAEASFIAGKEVGKGSGLLPLLFIWEFIKGAFSYSTAQLTGR